MPTGSMLWETGTLSVALRVDREKVMLALHCRRLGEHTLAGKVYMEQQAQGWPGLNPAGQRLPGSFSRED